VRKDLFGAVRLLLLPSLALIGLVLVAPGRIEAGVRIYALLLCATAITLLLLALRRAYPDETPLREPAPSTHTRTPPPSLVRIEREVALGAAGSFDLHYRLVPRLRSLAAGLLTSRHGVTLEDSPETARAILGEDAWELVRPGRPAPQERLAKGMPSAELAGVVDGLEGI
jgi:hypothetical protein